jgi:hypothetical protein
MEQLEKIREDASNFFASWMKPFTMGSPEHVHLSTSLAFVVTDLQNLEIAHLEQVGGVPDDVQMHAATAVDELISDLSPQDAASRTCRG